MYVGLNTALVCGRHVGLLRDGFCIFAVIITIIAYHALLKLLVSYRPYFCFLFLRLFIRCRSRILHSCIFSGPVSARILCSSDICCCLPNCQMSDDLRDQMTVSDVCLKLGCLPSISIFEVSYFMCCINSRLTYLLTCTVERDVVKHP